MLTVRSFSRPGDAGPVEVGTFDHEDRIVFAVERVDIADLVGTREACDTQAGLSPLDDDLGFFPERSQQPAKSERRTDAVAVGLDVRGYAEIVLVFN